MQRDNLNRTCDSVVFLFAPVRLNICKQSLGKRGGGGGFLIDPYLWETSIKRCQIEGKDAG